MYSHLQKHVCFPLPKNNLFVSLIYSIENASVYSYLDHIFVKSCMQIKKMKWKIKILSKSLHVDHNPTVELKKPKNKYSLCKFVNCFYSEPVYYNSK